MPINEVKRRGKLAPPNVDDPLSEPTLNRRLWALYLRLGYTRADFARALGKQYPVVSRWDTGEYAMNLADLKEACILLGVSTDDLIYGREARRPPPGATSPVTRDDELIRNALSAVDASPETRAAFAAHTESTHGRYQQITHEYVTRFAQVYEREIAAGTPPNKAHDRAYTEAINMRARVKAAAADADDQSASPRRRRTPPTRARPRIPTTRTQAH